MDKLILMSLLVATVALPVRASRQRNPRLALKRSLVYLFGFNFVYLFLILYVYPRL
jgi:hypothetical protein